MMCVWLKRERLTYIARGDRKKNDFQQRPCPRENLNLGGDSMKKTIKKIVSLFMVIVLMFTMSQSVFAVEARKVVGADEKTELNIETDKKKYSWGDTITFNITVKNVSGEHLDYVNVKVTPRNFSKFLPNGNSTVTVYDLEAGESETIQIKFDATRLMGGLMRLLVPFLMLFSDFAMKTLYRETAFNYQEKVKVGGIRYKFGFEVTYDKPESEDFLLSADKNEIPTDTSDEDVQVYFYAQPPEGYDAITLYSSDDMEAVTMKDDGAYSVSGDDIPNDGIFSAKISISNNKERTISFYAKAENEDTAVSENVDLYIYDELTEAELAKMDVVDNAVKEAMSEKSFATLSSEKKIEKIENVLDKLEKNNYIEKDSVKYSSESGLVSYKYYNGICGGASIYEFSDNINGRETNNPSLFQEENVKVNTLSTSQDDNFFAEGLILHSFGTSAYRNVFYNDAEKEWEEEGVDISIDRSVTVSDLKSIDGKNEIVCFSGHGSIYEGTTVMCTEETVTDDNRQTYTADLNKERIVPVFVEGELVYWVFPKLFEDHYNSNSFSNSIIFSECCMFFGMNDDNSEEFANAFINNGAKAVMGYYNSVGADYSRDFIKECIDNLILGDTIGEAFNKAIKEHGEDDKLPEKDKGKSFYQPKAATPNLRGDKNARLISSGIKNGSFEQATVPKFWKYKGDVRVIKKLGELTPQHEKNMAILTTGLGSMEAGYLAQEDGSLLEQTFLVSKDATTISFKYDVVSEEPMEYYGSKYDDKFIASIVDKNGSESQIVMETINSAQWYSIDNIDFEGGDHTTYHTGWKEVEMDISEYRGERLTLKFLVYDVGDSQYDTATIIDDVQIK